MLLALDDSVKQPTPEGKIDVAYLAALALVEVLGEMKMSGRTEQGRAISVAYTDAQKLVAWIKTYCME